MDLSSPAPRGPGTVVGPARWLLPCAVAGAPLLGAALAGWALPPLGRWLSGLPALPFRIVFRFLGGIDAWWEVALAVLVGAAVGLVLGLSALEGQVLRVSIDAEGLRLEGGTRDGDVARADVSAVFLDGSRLVVLGPDSFPVLHGPLPPPRTATADRLAKSARRYGYPWRDADPYAAEYRHWSHGRTPGLPPEAGTMLDARRTALERKAVREVAALEKALREHGWTVRDEDGQQYVRPLTR
ncbi:hypothetical protein AB0J21_04860 [Streptomyces sp. NPDC049954]|uniref:YqeB family protein n=1 Tax=Streptomyces sp. NPDC049954 TaxID=3155779 RepID=UPI003416AC6F